MKAQWCYVIIIYYCKYTVRYAVKEHIKESLSYNFLANDIMGKVNFQIVSNS